MGQQPLSVSSDGQPVPGPGTPIAATPAPALTVGANDATTSSTNSNNNAAMKGDQSTPDGNQESDSNSNPEYWRTQLITIMSEVERLKTQMGSITEQRSSQEQHMQHPQQQHSVASQNSASSAVLDNVATPPNQQTMTASNFEIQQTSNQMQQPAAQIVMVQQPPSVTRTPQMSNIETTPTKSPMMTSNNSVNSISTELRTDSPLTTTTPNSMENQ